MPFTLAHPAAVLPLRRFCPRYLSFSALVIGSTTADAGYCFRKYDLDIFSHSILGSFVFDLPVGALMLAALYLFRRPLVERLPKRPRELFRPLCNQPIASPLVLIVSLLIGSWTHLLWDDITHSHGWLANQISCLRIQVAFVRGRNVTIATLLLLASSFAGAAALCFAYERWCRARRGVITRLSMFFAVCNAVLVGTIILAIEVLHYLITDGSGLALVGLCSMILLGFVALAIGNVKPAQEK